VALELQRSTLGERLALLQGEAPGMDRPFGASAACAGTMDQNHRHRPKPSLVHRGLNQVCLFNHDRLRELARNG
jgi:hypothetical protein